MSYKNLIIKAGEAAQSFRVCTTLADDLGLVPSTHVCGSQLPVTPAPWSFLTFAGSSFMCINHIHIHIIYNNIKGKLFLNLIFKIHDVVLGI